MRELKNSAHCAQLSEFEDEVRVDCDLQLCHSATVFESLLAPLFCFPLSEYLRYNDICTSRCANQNQMSSKGCARTDGNP